MASASFLKCLLCKQCMVQPKFLSGCSHSFCLACLTDYCKTKVPGSEASCPVKKCQRPFLLPCGGVDSLPSNEFMSKLLDVEGRGKSRDDSQSGDEYCKTHPAERIRAFCANCQEIVCYTCFMVKHSGHSFSELTDVKSSLKKKLKENMLKTDESYCEVRKALNKIGNKLERFENKISNLEKDIVGHGEEYKRQIDDQVLELLIEAQTYKEKSFREIQEAKNELTERKTKLETLIEGANNLMKEMNIPSFVNSVIHLNKEQEEISKLDFNVPKLEFKISFSPGKLKHDFEVGRLHCEADEPPSSRSPDSNSLKNVASEIGTERLTPIFKYPSGGRNFQVCCIYANQLFLAAYSSNEVCVYDPLTLQFVHKFIVDDLKCPTSMTATCNCLFLTNIHETSVDIIRIDLSTYRSSSWSVPGCYGKLSLTDDDNLLLCSSEPNLLTEFSLEGREIMKVKLHKTVLHPVDAIRIDDDFILSCGGDHHLCKIDKHGKILASFTDANRHLKLQFHIPNHLLKQRNGNVLVFDSNNARIILVDDKLCCLKMISFDSSIFCNKTNGCLDEHDRLYLANVNESYFYVYDWSK